MFEKAVPRLFMVEGAFELTGLEGALANLHRLVQLKKRELSSLFSPFFPSGEIIFKISVPVGRDSRRQVTSRGTRSHGLECCGTVLRSHRKLSDAVKASMGGGEDVAQVARTKKPQCCSKLGEIPGNAASVSLGTRTHRTLPNLANPLT